VGNGRVICFSIYGGPEVDFGHGKGTVRREGGGEGGREGGRGDCKVRGGRERVREEGNEEESVDVSDRQAAHFQFVKSLVLPPSLLPSLRRCGWTIWA